MEIQSPSTSPLSATSIAGATAAGAARGFHWRALISVLIALCFLMLALTGIVLFIAPPGRVANWTNWSILGLRKSEWGGVHIWFGLLFLVVTVWHLILNWKPMLTYFKDRARRSYSMRREWLVAAGLTAVIFAGTKAGVTPFSSLLAWNESIKESWEQPATRAPIPHAELLTLQELAAKAGVDLRVALVRLEARGVKGAAPETVVSRIAEGAKLSAAQVYEIISQNLAPAAAGAEGHSGSGGGPGRKTLTQFCSEEGIEVAVALQRLAAKGFKATPELTLREVAVNNGFTKPYELMDLIRGRAAAK